MTTSHADQIPLLEELDRVKAALAEAEAKYRCLTEQSLVGVYLIQDGRFVYANARNAEIFGYTVDEIMQRPSVLDLVIPEDRALVAENLRKREHGDVQSIQYMFRGLRKDGRVVDVQVLGTRTIYNGRPAICGSLLDMTERTRSVQALRESEERLRLALDAGQLGTWDFNPQTRQVTWSDRCKDIFGFPQDAQITYEAYLARVHPDDRLRTQQAAAQALESHGGGVFQAEYRVVRPDGSVRWVVERGRVFFADVAGQLQPVRFTGTTIDVTDRKRAEEDRSQLLNREQAARAQAEAANRAKDQFLAILSHELRTPLTPALAAVGLLDRSGHLGLESRQLLDIVRRNVELESRIIDDLLDLTQINRGRLQLKLAIVDAHVPVKDAVTAYQKEIAAKQLHVEVELSAREHQVRADASRIQQVFWNLIGNAIKFTPAGGNIRVCSSCADGLLRLEVIDSGVGIDTEVMARLFRTFEQGEQSLTRKFGGLGLGLSICKALVEAHGGRIRATSDGKGRGAAFTVELPAVSEAERIAPPVAAEKRGRRLLLVEDNEDSLRMLARLLRSLGHEVRTASSIQGAIDTAAAADFDLLISDIGLPDGSGWELMRQLRSRRDHVAGIAISGFGTDEDIARSREAGFITHLVKPVNVQMLEQAIAAVT